MDARRRFWTTAFCLLGAPSLGAANDALHRTSNFVVHAPTQQIARQVAEAAEVWREELAMQWLGKKLPRWVKPCEVQVHVGQIGAGGATTFSFEGGEVFGWNMRVQGSLERILDSVVPHEVSHTIFACHFRRPLPRWADEGAATLVEHHSERRRQLEILAQVTRDRQRIPLARLLTIDEYPKDMQQVLALYAEGYSLAEFLVQQHGDRGRAVYLEFLGDALGGDWEAAFRKHYGFASISDLEQKWGKWIMAGSPPLRRPDDGQLAQVTSTTANPAKSDRVAANDFHRAAPEAVAIRGQSESDPPPSPGLRESRTAASPSSEIHPEETPAPSPPPLAPTRRVALPGHSPAPLKPL